jgi:hypothetical protein
LSHALSSDWLVWKSCEYCSQMAVTLRRDVTFARSSSAGFA